MTPFAVIMAWRETRAGWRHFVYFLLCIALGVGALVGVGLFAANVERTVIREARSLMGGDIEVRLSRPMSDQGLAVLRSLEAQGVSTMHVSELVAMAARANGGPDANDHRGQAAPTQLVELKAIESNYPFYGALRTVPARPALELLAARPCHFRNDVDCYGALVQQSLLIKMGASVGDEMKIGQAYVSITGTIEHEPDRAASAFSLGPRVMISQAALHSADLVKPGSRVRERHLVKLPTGRVPEPVLRALQTDLASESARVTTFHDAQPQLRRFLNQLTRYLGLVGLTALFVGGIGVASTIHAFLKEKLKTIAILKTVGAASGTIMLTYLLQALFLALIGSLLGVGLGMSVQGAIPALVAHVLPANLLDASAPQELVAEPVARGLLLGVSTTLLFALWPLLGIRAVRPALIFRADIVQSEGEGLLWRRRWIAWTRDRLRLVMALLIATGLMALAVWQARSLVVGLLFIAALLAAVIILLGASALLLSALKASPPPASLALRHAVRNLARPGSQASSVMMAVGIGVMVIAAVSLLERSLVHQIGESRPVDAPTFFFIDIQPDQKDGFDRLLRERLPHASPQFTPLVRSRLSAVNGVPVPASDGEGRGRSDAGQEHGKSWYLTREYVLTFLERLPKDNVVTQGRWWSDGAPGIAPLVSVEEEAARNLNVGLGSVLEFDIQGTTLAATVSNIRSVEWSNFSTNFYMILSPGSLEGAPFTYVATVQVPPDDEVPVQQAVVEAFPNVTAINIAEVMQTFSAVLEHLSFAIRAVAVFCLLAGGIVMAAALATTRYRRLYESVIFKAVGATRAHIARSFAAEYALMGALAGLIGIVLANVLSWGVLYYVFDLPWTFQPSIIGAAVAAAITLSVAVGFLTTFRILGEPPLAILRHE
jgi:putative ABC transport system permease protein